MLSQGAFPSVVLGEGLYLLLDLMAFAVLSVGFISVGLGVVGVFFPVSGCNLLQPLDLIEQLALVIGRFAFHFQINNQLKATVI